MHLLLIKFYLKTIIHEFYARILGKSWNNMKINMEIFSDLSL